MRDPDTARRTAFARVLATEGLALELVSTASADYWMAQASYYWRDQEVA